MNNPEQERARLSDGAEVLAARTANPTRKEPDCEVLIVGSGYGGAVAAARLAGAWPDGGSAANPVSVWVLERGLEHLPGSFPARFGDLPGQVRFSKQNGKPARGYLQGLYDIRIGDDVNVLVGNGLGGGSLINAGVMARPDAEVFGSDWPAALWDQEARQPGAALRRGYELAMEMLEAAPLPDRFAPAKLKALQAMAGADAAAVQRCDIAVNFDGRPTRAGVPMNACTQCGDCITGCNVGAKRTLDTNYLAWARAAGADLFTGGWVETIEPHSSGDGWLVYWHYTDTHKRPPRGKPFCIFARRVVLAAGSLGSTEILLRSAGRLRCSEALGRRFSTNGDQIAAGFRQRDPVHASRDEDRPAWKTDNSIGPTITGLLRTDAAGESIAVQEFAVPAPLRRVMGEVTTTFGLLQALFAGPLENHPADQDHDEELLGVTTSSLEFTSIVGLMGDDGAKGRIVGSNVRNGDTASDGLVRIDWSGDRERLEQLSEAQLAWVETACRQSPAGGTAVPNPTWSVLPSTLAGVAPAQRRVATTVHPLGGCCMGNSAADGVVDRCGRVFNPAGGVHAGLAVLDGSIVPKALGINPALTIAALAEQAVPDLAREWGLVLATERRGSPTLTERERALQTVQARQKDPDPDADPAAALPTSIRISEKMTGSLQPVASSRAWPAEIEISDLEIPSLALLLRHGSGEYGFSQARLSVRGPRGMLTVPLRGTMSLLVQGKADQESVVIDALSVVLERVRSRNRASPDGGQPVRLKSLEEKDFTDKLMQFLANMAQSRQIVYRFEVLAVRPDDGKPFQTDADGNAVSIDGLPPGTRLVGTKTLVFGERSNPWRQLMQMELSRQAGNGQDARRLGLLETDLGYFARFRQPLLGIVGQHDHASAIADVAGFVLLVLRSLLLTQLPHFIPPGDMAQRVKERWPGPVNGQDPQIYRLDHGARLSRYQPAGDALALPPLLLIHGLSAAGSTFTHRSIPGNLASFMLNRGRDVWVLDLRTSSANEPPRRGPFAFEEVANGDIPAAIDTIVQARNGGSVDVVAHCIGAAMFSLAVLQRPGLHRCIGHAVLSQVGPLSQMTPFNRVRGYVASFLEHYLEIDEVDVRPDWRWVDQPADGGRVTPVLQPDERPSQGRMLTDALLATFPYPDDDFEAARALSTLRTEPGGGDFRLVRHRADAIFGQTMRLDNVADDTLLALDALFGWVKTRTMAQTIHLARQGVLTNADGINAGLSSDSIVQRMAFPVLFLHGERNEVFEVEGSRRSYELFKRVFNEPVGANSALDGGVHLGAGTPRQLRVVRGYGHQDILIGKSAQCDVFPFIESFLAQHFAPATQQPLTPSRFGCEAPWMGPMLGALQSTGKDKAQLSLLVHAGGRRADVLCVVLVPAFENGRDDDGETVYRLDYERAVGRRVGGASGATQREKLLNEALCIEVDLRPAPAAYMVLLLHRELQDPDTGATDFQHPAAGAARASPAEPFELSAEALQAVRRFVAANNPPLKRQLFVLDRNQLAAADRGGWARQPAVAVDLRFVVGSCQYAQGLFDKTVADAAFKRIFELALDGGAGAPAFMLALGDQVYLDAMANVFDVPGFSDADTARRAYELNWRLPWFRALVSRLPVYAMFDDHEVLDNWRPGVTDPGRVAAGLAAWRQHQGKLNPAPPDGREVGDPSYAFRFAPAGLPIFVLDTRSARQLRGVGPRVAGAVPVESARIIPKADMQALKEWLLDHQDWPLKFIASPSGVLPIEAAENRSLAERLGCDSWAGYPASLHELLSFIDGKGLRGVVFLCGDAHMSSVSQLNLPHSVVHSVVSSGFYAPWSFTNGRPQDTVNEGHEVTFAGPNGASLAGTLRYLITPKTAPRFAVIHVKVADVDSGLKVDFHDLTQPAVTSCSIIFGALPRPAASSVPPARANRPAPAPAEAALSSIQEKDRA